LQRAFRRFEYKEMQQQAEILSGAEVNLSQSRIELTGDHDFVVP